jgi:hypothetical protein
LAPGASCNFLITFKPGAIGVRTASLTLTDNATNSPQNVLLSGTGVTGSAVTLSPASLSFPAQTVGTSSAQWIVTLTNTGAATLAINEDTLTGADPSDFTHINECPNDLAPGASCNFLLTFRPTVTGVRTANLTLTDNAHNSPQTVSLAGTGQ